MRGAVACSTGTAAQCGGYKRTSTQVNEVKGESERRPMSAILDRRLTMGLAQIQVCAVYRVRKQDEICAQDLAI